MAEKGRPRPDVVIGVDFGMTSTGVAYCTSPWNNVKTFQSWGTIVSEVANKVPSRIAYSTQTGAIKAWGFGVDVNDPDADLQEFFKLYLDPEYQDDFEGISHQEAQRYYKDYLSLVHDHVVQFFASRLPNWTAQTVEWVFSVPTTWQNPKLIYQLEDLLRDAGFGRDGMTHSVRITLTEAEAAAICVAADYIERNDVLVICDAGGGTTDVNILRLASSRGQPTKLQPLYKVEGKAVGSALIDIRVQQYLEQRLAHVADKLPGPPADIAERMMIGRFERFKCTFGTSASDIPLLLLEIPGLPPNTDVPLADIKNSRISVSQSFLKELFDEQVDAMIELLSEQITNFGRVEPGTRVNYLILSGGLGSSQYVRDRIQQHFQYGEGSRLGNAMGMKLLLAENPQLAVVLGLVMDRAQELGRSVQPISERCARVNYGVVVNQPFNPQKHFNQRVVTDPRDKRKWAIDQIEWLIREGDRINESGVSKHVRAKLHPAQLRRPWKAHFVISNNPRHALPLGLDDNSVHTLCIVEADLSQVQRKEMNGHWWQMGKVYEIAEFDLRVVPGAADLQFQLWNNGRLITSQNQGVRVDWNAGSASGQGLDNDFGTQ